MKKHAPHAAQIMNADPIVVTEDQKLRIAAEKMWKQKAHASALVDAELRVGPFQPGSGFTLRPPRGPLAIGAASHGSRATSEEPGRLAHPRRTALVGPPPG